MIFTEGMMDQSVTSLGVNQIESGEQQGGQSFDYAHGENSRSGNEGNAVESGKISPGGEKRLNLAGVQLR
ncbi:MAG: hypothetical protein NZ703_13140 [Gemmataceae bacterium]|nr:hypothetical protein [Gemmataceae bacterium]MCS7272019.1 hypothetical protein [Gemmataceae bacterium]